jgi:hypothetical protein
MECESETIRLYVCSEAIIVILKENFTRVLIVYCCDEGLEKKDYVEEE